MKKIIDAMAGGKVTNPAKRSAATAAVITFAVLLVAALVLGVSSIIFAVRGGDAESDTQDTGGAQSTEAPVSTTLNYTEITKDELEAKLEGTVEFTSRDERAINNDTNNLYYAKLGTIKLAKSAMSGAHNMFVDFYKANTAKLKTDVTKSDCTIPLVSATNDSGTQMKLKVYGSEAEISNAGVYMWLYSNAYKYGFVASDNSFTYVGTALATYMRSSNVSTLDALATRLENAGSPVKYNSYQFYYLSADSALRVPTDYSYNVIPNGTEGYIITVVMSERQ